jgi:FixJ family two-component response regulator
VWPWPLGHYELGSWETPDVSSGSVNMVAIIDDDGDVRDVLDALLESVGHTVKTYTSGQQFLDDPDLSDIACVIVDQKMPIMTGLDLLRQLDARGLTIPSVLITGSPEPGVANEARALGAIEVLAKPIDLETLLRVVAYTAH